MKKSKWGHFIFFAFSPLMWMTDIIFGTKQFRVKISEGCFTSKINYFTARKLSSVYNGPIFWRRRNKWKRI